jgi:hypothetical protein
MNVGSAALGFAVRIAKPQAAVRGLELKWRPPSPISKFFEFLKTLACVSVITVD